MADLKIGDRNYEVPELPAFESFTMQPRLAPIIAEVAVLAFGALSKLKDEDGKDLDLKNMSIEQFMALDVGIDTDAVLAAVARVCAKLPQPDFKRLVRDLLGGARCNGAQLFTENGNPFDVLMRGRTLETWRLLFFAVQINYPDVFSRRGASGAQSPAASPSAA